MVNDPFSIPRSFRG